MRIEGTIPRVHLRPGRRAHMIRSLASALAACALVACAASGGAGSSDAGKPLLLIVGATGGTGQEVVSQALARGYAVRVLVRDEDKARTLFGDQVAYAVGDV